ncbi:hypothetical protein CB0940_11682 [Cercospora beticola]|uniref:Uncharacterized protein n=1 Tax=Cercospora beticola TaxID=122368 RepID=A0A2G5IFL8_CERBT|nr:hypothetical protein CB0940_11682 [Cercospora beticola]PIB03263.1 hypothetical protein CB0940_11682 [Cercospora beticola]WPB04037.1 hypothetical protein RHO25_008681 [Cercospora beticola]
MRFTAFLATIIALLTFSFAAPMPQGSVDSMSTLEARGIASLALKFIKKINPAKPPSPMKPISPAMKAEHQRMELLRKQPWYKEPTN